MPIETIVFDHSGTLSNDFPLCFASTNNILRIFGSPRISEARYRAVFGNDVVAVYRGLGVSASLEELNKIHARYLKSESRPVQIPFAAETVKIASKLVKKIVGFSAHPEEEIRQDLLNWGIYGFFDKIYGGAQKQSDADFEKMLKETDSKRENTLFVGDTTVDIDLAKRNLVKCAVVVNPKYCYQEPEKVKSHYPSADYYLNDISALIPLLKKKT